MKDFEKLLVKLEAKIENSYDRGVTMEQAEKLAGEFLVAQIKVSARLADSDLDSRMRKAGVKAIRAKVYLDTKSDSAGPKMTEAGVAAVIDSHEIVQSEQEALDIAEVNRDELERYYNIFQNAHIHFRSIAKGAFGNG